MLGGGHAISAAVSKVVATLDVKQEEKINITQSRCVEGLSLPR